MIESGADTVFDIEGVRQLKPVALVDLIHQGAEGWVTRETDQVLISPDRIEISGGGRSFVSLQRDVDWTADEIDALSFEVSDLAATGRSFRIYWARANEFFSEERMVQAAEASPGTALMTMAT